MQSLKTIDENVLKLLRCPITQSELTLADEGLLNQVNDRMDADDLRDNSGIAVQHHLEAALVNLKQSILVPIRAGVILMTRDKLITLET